MGACIIIRKNASVLKNTFPLQSFLDNTQLNQALLAQDSTSFIVGTPTTTQVTGRVIGLHPNSQCPVAVTLQGPAGALNIVLTPGQIFRGMPDGFTSIIWGLPFGWLGGGLVKLIVADADDAFLGWPQTLHEVLLQRLRLQIIADAAPTVTPNAYAAALPLRFPWKNGYRYNTAAPASPIPQTGLGEIAAIPTRLVMRLRVSTLAAPTTMRIILQGVDDFDLDATGAAITYTSYSFDDVTWPQAVGLASDGFPVKEFQNGLELLRGDSMIVTLTDAGNAALTNAYVDILSYGQI